MTRRRLVRWLLTSMAAGLAALTLVAWRCLWTPLPYYTDYGSIDLPEPILTAEQYDKESQTHARPYVVELEREQGAVVLYGASHTKRPEDPQLDDLRRRWGDFRPTIALLEGRMGYFVTLFSDPVRKFGEGGFVSKLARGQRVKLYTWEPPLERELELVLERHPKERVALFYILRPYISNLRHGRPADPDGVVESTRRKRVQWAGLEGAYGSVAEIDDTWRRDFAGEKDWRDTSDEHGYPCYLNEVWKASNAARDEHFTRVIVDLVRKGERVFAVCGSSHAVKLDTALRAALRAK